MNDENGINNESTTPSVRVSLAEEIYNLRIAIEGLVATLRGAAPGSGSSGGGGMSTAEYNELNGKITTLRADLAALEQRAVGGFGQKLTVVGRQLNKNIQEIVYPAQVAQVTALPKGEGYASWYGYWVVGLPAYAGELSLVNEEWVSVLQSLTTNDPRVKKIVIESITTSSIDLTLTLQDDSTEDHWLELLDRTMDSSYDRVPEWGEVGYYELENRPSKYWVWHAPYYTELGVGLMYLEADLLEYKVEKLDSAELEISFDVPLQDNGLYFISLDGTLEGYIKPFIKYACRVLLVSFGLASENPEAVDLLVDANMGLVLDLAPLFVEKVGGTIKINLDGLEAKIPQIISVLEKHKLYGAELLFGVELEMDNIKQFLCEMLEIDDEDFEAMVGAYIGYVAQMEFIPKSVSMPSMSLSGLVAKGLPVRAQGLLVLESMAYVRDGKLVVEINSMLKHLNLVGSLYEEDYFLVKILPSMLVQIPLLVDLYDSIVVSKGGEI